MHYRTIYTIFLYLYKFLIIFVYNFILFCAIKQLNVTVKPEAKTLYFIFFIYPLFFFCKFYRNRGRVEKRQNNFREKFFFVRMKNIRYFFKAKSSPFVNRGNHSRAPFTNLFVRVHQYWNHM